MATLTGETRCCRYAALSTIGSRRAGNEDAFAVFEATELFVVADGCGGRSSGETAARLAVECFGRHSSGAAGPTRAPFGADSLCVAAIDANAAILRDSRDNPDRRGQGAALCAMRVSNGWVTLLHVGDSRIARRRGDALTWLTEDHSLLAELRRGGASAEELERAKEHVGVIVRALGTQEQLPFDVAYHPTEPGDLYLLCTDGLAANVDRSEIAAILAEASRPLAARALALAGAAEAAGGWDNTTVILVELRG